MAHNGLSLDRSDETNNEIAEINIIPLVDVLLVLLIIFMVAAPLSLSGIKIELPTSKAKGPVGDEQKIILSINEKGLFYVETKQIPAIKLEEEMRNMFKFRERKEIYIRGDRQVPYGSIVDAMSAAKIAGVTKISMLTKQPAH